MDSQSDALDQIQAKVIAPQLDALYQIHRYQMLLRSKDHNGEYQLPEAYLYAVAKGIYPHCHKEWCYGNNDPYADCYPIKQDLIEKIVESLEADKPTYSDLERLYGGNKVRTALQRILRYLYLSEEGHNELYQKIFEVLPKD
jgi:hypothetical protein